MSDDKKLVHKLFFPKAGGGHTLCGIEITAFYPMSMYAMTDVAGKENIRVTLGRNTSCEECKKKDKDGG